MSRERWSVVAPHDTELVNHNGIRMLENHVMATRPTNVSFLKHIATVPISALNVCIQLMKNLMNPIQVLRTERKGRNTCKLRTDKRQQNKVGAIGRLPIPRLPHHKVLLRHMPKQVNPCIKKI